MYLSSHLGWDLIYEHLSYYYEYLLLLWLKVKLDIVQPREDVFKKTFEALEGHLGNIIYWFKHFVGLRYNLALGLVTS